MRRRHSIFRLLSHLRARAAVVRHAGLADVGKLAAFTLAYCFSAYLSVTFSASQKEVVLFWPAAGIALAAVMLMGRGAWPVAFLGSFWISLYRDAPPLHALPVSMGATLEVLAIFWLFGRVRGFSRYFVAPRDAITFMLVTLAGAAISPCIGLTSYTIAGLFPWQDYPIGWLKWCLGDWLGMLIVTPFVLAWMERDAGRRSRSRASMTEIALYYGVLMFVADLVFGSQLGVISLRSQAGFLIYPVLIWAALRFGLKELTTGLMLLVLAAMLGTARGYGSFSLDHAASWGPLTLFLGIASAIGLSVHAVRMAEASTQRELWNTNERYNNILETVPDAIMYKDGTGHWILANQAAQRLFHLEGTDWCGKTDAELIQACPGLAVLATDNIIWAEDGGPFSLSSLVDPHGQIRQYEVRKFPILKNDGHAGLAIAGRDVTERANIEMALRFSVSEFRALAENSPDIIERYDRALTHLYANPAIRLFCGFAPEEVIGKSYLELEIPDDGMHERWEKSITHVFDTGCPETIEFTRQTPSGERHFQSLMIPEHDQHGTVLSVLVISRDVTSLNLTKIELQVAYQVLRKLTTKIEIAREEERKTVAREVHDELGQVLTALRLKISMLDMVGGVQTPSVAAMVQEMTVLVDRAIRGVRNVVDNLRPAVLDMGMVAALEWLCGQYPQSGGSVHLNVAGELAELNEDRRVFVFRIVQESLTNAARYAEANVVAVSVIAGDNDLMVEVRDDGKGFSVEALAGKRSFGLMGMRERAVALGGTLEITSAPGQGTVVTLRIPRHHQWSVL